MVHACHNLPYYLFCLYILSNTTDAINHQHSALAKCAFVTSHTFLLSMYSVFS